jgi:hypothetical protein
VPTYGSPLLGVSVTTRNAPPTGGVPTATDAWFVAAYTDVGTSLVPQLVRDLAEFETKFGVRTGVNIALWDAMDVFFREGGKQAWVVRGAIAGLQAALDTLLPTMGPGQVSAVNYTFDATGATLQALISHAAANNRVAIADTADISDVTALKAYGNLIQDETIGSGGVFAPYLIVPAPAGVVGGSTRRVPPSSAIAGLCARVDETGNPNQAAAGRSLAYQYVSDLAYDFLAVDRIGMLDAGVNTSAEVYGVLENYGFQTLVPQSVDNPYWQLNCARMRMALVAQAQAIGENYVFRPIDGQGSLANAFKNQLEAMLLGYWTLGALYGTDPQDAFRVEVGSTINTTTTIAQGKLRAVADVCLTLHAKAVSIDLVTVPVGGNV